MSPVNVGALVGTAAGLGVVHVLTGPDHMSAVATLSANVRTRQAFWLGVRWGVGHSAGLLLVGIVLIAVTVPANDTSSNQESGGDDEGEGGGEVAVPHAVEMAFESLVGVFMLLLGAYGIHRAVSRRRARSIEGEKEERQQRQQEEENHEERDERCDLEGADGAPYQLEDDDPAPFEEGRRAGAGASHPASAQVLLRGSTSIGQEAEFQPAAADYASSVVLDGEGSSLLVTAAASAATRPDAPGFVGGALSVEGAAPPTRGGGTEEDGTGGAVAPPAPSDLEATAPPPARCCRCLSNVPDRVSAGLAALLMGTVHGLAGPGGVLGVIPAVQLRDWKLAILYLGTFCVVSTLTMGAFATVFGTLSSKLVDRSAARLQFCMEFFPSCLSIVVGVVWLVLSPMGKLEEIFG